MLATVRVSVEQYSQNWKEMCFLCLRLGELGGGGGGWGMGLGFRVWGLGFRVSGFGFRV